MEFQSHRWYSGTALNYGDLPGEARGHRELHPWVLHRANGGLEAGGSPVLSEIAENKIMGEMNGGGGRCKAAGGRGGGWKLRQITPFTDGVTGWGWTGWRGGWTDGRQGQRDERGGTSARCKARHWDASPGYQKVPSEQRRRTPDVCPPRANGAWSGGQWDQGPATGTGGSLGWGLLPATCAATATTPSLCSPAPASIRSRSPLKGCPTEPPSHKSTWRCRMTPGMGGGWPSQPMGEEYGCSSASGGM